VDKDQIQALSEEEKAAYVKLLLQSEKDSSKKWLVSKPPQARWKLVPALLGLPVTREERALTHPLELLVLLTVAGLFFWHFLSLEKAVSFLMGGYYFYLFSDEAFEAAGSFRVFLMLAAAHGMGWLLMKWMVPSSAGAAVWSVDAEVGALMGFSLWAFPKRRFDFLIFYVIVRSLWVRVPAWGALAVKMGWDFFSQGAFPWSVVGGALIGLIFALLLEDEALVRR